MALVMADLGIDVLLGTFFVATAVQNTALKLYIDNQTPDANGGDALADYTECLVEAGYDEIELARGTWVLTPANDPTDVVYPQQTFTFTGPLTDAASIYGYFVTNAAGTVLLWAEKLAAPFTPANNGDKLLITPKLQASFGTPAA